MQRILWDAAQPDGRMQRILWDAAQPGGRMQRILWDAAQPGGRMQCNRMQHKSAGDRSANQNEKKAGTTNKTSLLHSTQLPSH
jgi:hypothetical protein